MSRRTRDVVSALAIAVLFALPLLPEFLGARRLIFRDAQITHWPWHEEAARQLASGRAPFVNAAASGGQPLLANPNAVLLYPTFLLPRVVSPGAAFNLHYLLHVLWAFFGARALARRCGMASGGALVAGAAYGFSGMMLSYGSAFMNSSAAAAWLPWCGAALLDVGRAADGRTRVRAAAAAGLAMGLQLLAGEPAISLITIAVGAALLVAASLAAPRGQRAANLARSLLATAGAGVLAVALAAPLLLPLRAVFPLTYRGQHQFSEKAFGAAAFTPGRAIEWLLPRFGGNPDLLGGGANWLRSITREDFVYIWCVTFGVVPLLLVALAALDRDFWNRRSAAVAAAAVGALLFAFGFALPFYRLVFSIAFLRRLRYPIKFYLVTTLAVALLAGLAAEHLGARRPRRRQAVLLAAILVLFGCAWAAAAPGGLLDRWAGPVTERVAEDPAGFLEVFRGLVRGDALYGALAALLVALALRAGHRRRFSGSALAALVLISSFPWGLPLFVAAPAAELDRPPALARRLAGPGRLYVSPLLPRFDAAFLRGGADEPLPKTARTARILVEQMVPLTGASFGVRYIFESDPDGSYGYFNRLVNEAADVSTPLGRDRLLTLYGARWALADEAEEHPLFRPATGLEIAGRRLVLYENPSPLPELRWAGRAWRRTALSDALDLLRSDAFDPARDVVLRGRRRDDAAATAAAARVTPESVEADGAAATVEAEGAGHVVFARTFFPSWRARVDGNPAPVLVANARDLAVPVPAGRHRVEIAWDAQPFRVGVGLQALALGAAAIAALAARPASAGRQQAQVVEQA